MAREAILQTKLQHTCSGNMPSQTAVCAAPAGTLLTGYKPTLPQHVSASNNSFFERACLMLLEVPPVLHCLHLVARQEHREAAQPGQQVGQLQQVQRVAPAGAREDHVDVDGAAALRVLARQRRADDGAPVAACARARPSTAVQSPSKHAIVALQMEPPLPLPPAVNPQHHIQWFVGKTCERANFQSSTSHPNESMKGCGCARGKPSAKRRMSRTLSNIGLVVQRAHERVKGLRDLLHAEARLPRRGREAVPGQRRCDHVEGLRLAAIRPCLGHRQRLEHLVELCACTWPKQALHDHRSESIPGPALAGMQYELIAVEILYKRSTQQIKQGRWAHGGLPNCSKLNAKAQILIG